LPIQPPVNPPLSLRFCRGYFAPRFSCFSPTRLWSVQHGSVYLLLPLDLRNKYPLARLRRFATFHHQTRFSFLRLCLFTRPSPPSFFLKQRTNQEGTLVRVVTCTTVLPSKPFNLPFPFSTDEKRDRPRIMSVFPSLFVHPHLYRFFDITCPLFRVRFSYPGSPSSRRHTHPLLTSRFRFFSSFPKQASPPRIDLP